EVFDCLPYLNPIIPQNNFSRDVAEKGKKVDARGNLSHNSLLIHCKHQSFLRQVLINT
ncbi:uncharacterized protein METZ01_LOCUS454657, partial [marine metagenome]